MPPTKYTPANNAIAKARFLKESKNPALDISKKAKMAKTIDDYNPRKNDWKGVDTPGSKTLQQQKKAWIQHVMDTHAAMGGSLKEAMIAASKTWRKKGASKVKKSSSGKKVAFAEEAPVSVPLPELDTSYVSELTDLENMYKPKPTPDTSYVDELNDLEAAYKSEGVVLGPKPPVLGQDEVVPVLSPPDADYPKIESPDKAAESRRKYEDKGVTLEDVREFGGGFNDDVREFGGGFNVPPPVSLPLPALTSFFGGVDDDEWGEFQSGGPALDEWGEFQSAVPTQPPQDAPKKQQTFKQWLQEKRIRENEQKAAQLALKNEASAARAARAKEVWEKQQARKAALHKIDMLKIQNERAVNKAIQESSAPPISPGMLDDNDVDDDVPELVPHTDTFIVRKAPVSIPLPILKAQPGFVGEMKYAQAYKTTPRLKKLEPYQVQLGLYPEVTPVPSSPFPTTTLWQKKTP